VPLESLSALPAWLIFGVVGGLGASALVGGVFYFGDRLFPPAEQTHSYSYDGTARRRDEIREYLRLIDEPFKENQLINGNQVAFYLPPRDVAITFNVASYFGLQSTDTYVILCEHEMPGHQIGRRLPFEVPTVTVRPPSGNEVEAAFDQLGIDQSATEAEIKKAYRGLVKEVHPDQGGTQAEFTQVQEAYTTALNHAEPATA